MGDRPARRNQDAGRHPMHERRTLHALVTLGPTHEPVDDVRFLGNRSSGRLGVEIARALANRGCRVGVLAGPCQPPELASLPEVQRFRTAEELRTLLDRTWPSCDLLVMAAAVADWRPVSPGRGKWRRSDGPMRLDLEPVPEILGALRSRPDQFVVGFALEPAEDLMRSAAAKLQRKRADCIVANPLQTMDAADIDGTLVWPDGRADSAGTLPKPAFAEWLSDRILPAAFARCGIR